MNGITWMDLTVSINRSWAFILQDNIYFVIYYLMVWMTAMRNIIVLIHLCSHSCFYFLF